MNIFIVVVALIIIFIFSYVFLTYRKYKKVRIDSDLSGFDVSRKIIDDYDLNNVYITESRDIFFSKYVYARKVIRLSDEVFNDSSISSIAIAARSACYAIKDKKKDKIFNIKFTLENFIKLILVCGYIILIIGTLFGHMNTIYLGMGLIAFILLYYVILLGTENDISSMAFNELVDKKIITKKEAKIVEKALRVLSMTDIASIFFPFAILMRKIIDFGKSSRWGRYEEPSY